MASLAVGLQSLVGLVRSDPRASDYYIHGFAGLSGDVITYAIVAGIVSNVCDGFLLALLEDEELPGGAASWKDFSSKSVSGSIASVTTPGSA